MDAVQYSPLATKVSLILVTDCFSRLSERQPRERLAGLRVLFKRTRKHRHISMSAALPYKLNVDNIIGLDVLKWLYARKYLGHLLQSIVCLQPAQFIPDLSTFSREDVSGAYLLVNTVIATSLLSIVILNNCRFAGQSYVF